MTPREMAERCAKCSSQNVICLYGAARLISNAQAKQRRRIIAIIKGGDRPWQELVNIILAEEDE